MNARVELLLLLQEQQRRKKERLIFTQWEERYAWQREFIAATATYRICCLMAANRVGKTETGLLIDAMHLTGDYPNDWTGHRFEHAPLIWLLGVTGEKTRDLLQTPLFGKLNDKKELEGGLISVDRIYDTKSMTGTPGGMREVRVKHKSGGYSTVQFWSYSQGQAVLMGDSLDWYHIDEEPKDQTIYPQVLVRTATGDRGNGGRGILTFTPENGRTDLVIQFMDNPTPDQFFMQKGWDDAPHLTEETKKALLAAFPPHQRDMRTKGEPMLGHGRIYDIGDDDILCDPFEIPKHFYVINGLDFGDDHPQAHVQLAEDRDNDIIYVTRSWKAPRQSAANARAITQSWARQYPYAWPQDGLQHEKAREDAVQLKKHYIDAGCKLLHEHAQFPDGSKSVELGIHEIRERMESGRFKIFLGQQDLMDEIRQYHRKENGRIVKVRDDLVDAMRYAYTMRRFAVQYGSELQSSKPRMPKPITPMGRR